MISARFRLWKGIAYCAVAAATPWLLAKHPAMLALQMGMLFLAGGLNLWRVFSSRELKDK